MGFSLFHSLFTCYIATLSIYLRFTIYIYYFFYNLTLTLRCQIPGTIKETDAPQLADTDRVCVRVRISGGGEEGRRFM